MFSYLEKGISRDIWSCDVVSASDIDLLRIFMCFCIIFVISAPFSAQGEMSVDSPYAA
ncbi:MAG: hypothetical protein J6P47_01465 [Acetobacter sp.]|nr:hypothetical protein [Acetobacter sp.]